jgi:hypothetical protein
MEGDLEKAEEITWLLSEISGFHRMRRIPHGIN